MSWKSKKQKKQEAEERQKKYDALTFEQKCKKAGRKEYIKLLRRRDADRG